MNCKSCDNGLRPEEEVEEQCLYCADEERDKQCEKDWSNTQIDKEYVPKHCPNCNARVFCLECATEV